MTFKDLIDGTGKSKSGYEQASILRRNKSNVMNDLQCFWLDTCCVDKSNHAELSREINAIFRRYRWE